MLTDLIFQTPWWLPTAIIAAGVGLMISGNSRQASTRLRTGLATILAGIALGTISYCVDTDREKAVHRTQLLVESANKRDWAAFRAQLDPQTAFYALKGPDQITAVAKSGAEQVNLSQAKITGMDVRQADTLITITTRIFAESSAGSGLTDWQFQFQDFGNHWTLQSIQALSNPSISEDQIRKALSRFR